MDRLRIAKIVTAAGLATGFGTASNAVAQDSIDFEKTVFPIIQEKCVECHRAPYEKSGRIRKPKANLRYDAAWGFVKGGDTGPTLVPGKPEKSEMLRRVMLPEDDDEHMPNIGDGLTDQEKEVLRKWIAAGADFGGWKGSQEGRPDDAQDAFPK